MCVGGGGGGGTGELILLAVTGRSTNGDKYMLFPIV